MLCLGWTDIHSYFIKSSLTTRWWIVSTLWPWGHQLSWLDTRESNQPWKLSQDAGEGLGPDTKPVPASPSPWDWFRLASTSSSFLQQVNAAFQECTGVARRGSNCNDFFSKHYWFLCYYKVVFHCVKNLVHQIFTCAAEIFLWSVLIFISPSVPWRILCFETCRIVLFCYPSPPEIAAITRLPDSFALTPLLQKQPLTQRECPSFLYFL